MVGINGRSDTIDIKIWSAITSESNSLIVANGVYDPSFASK